MSARRISNIPYRGQTIEAIDLRYTAQREDWNLYELEDGTLLKIRIIPQKITRGIDTESGDILRVPESNEPFYYVRYNVMVVAEVPDSLMTIDQVEAEKEE